jgi:hypothetical protein
MEMHMNGSLLKFAAIAAWLCLVAATVAAEPFTARPVGLTVEDIASALHLTWWKHHLQFDKLVKDVSVTLYELKPKEGGGWERTRLSVSSGISSQDQKLRDVTVAVVLHPGEKDPEMMLGFSGTVQSNSFQKLEKMPDFTNLTLLKSGNKIVDGCIVLGAEYKNRRATDREQDMLRVLGLEIKAE